MITDSFLDNCYQLIFSKKQQELDQSVYQNLLHFFDFVENEMGESHDIPLNVKAKFDLFKKVCQQLSCGKSIFDINASVMISEKFRDLIDYIDLISSQTLDKDEQERCVSTINKLMTWIKLNSTFKRFADYEEVVRDGCFDTLDEVITEYTDMVKGAASDVAEYEFNSNNGLVSTLNTREDSLDPVFDEIRKKYAKQNVITSGVPELNIDFLSGGFQPSRVYLFLGTAGIGKSLLLLNMAIRAAIKDPNENMPFKFSGSGFWDDSPERVFLYITMENYPYETLCRLYCSMFNKTKEEMLRMIFDRSISSERIREEINEMMAPNNSSIQIDYFPANTISPATISALIQKYNKYPEKKLVKAVYIDYLDLLLPDVGKDLWRLDLGEITSNLKTIAARFEIPIITATQLNREAYRRNKKMDLGAEMISESIQKLFIADFSAVMVRDNVGYDENKTGGYRLPQKVILKVDKNRDGKTGQTNIYFDYAKARLLTIGEFNSEYEKILKM
jgi:replicative DNA helicase